MTDELTKDELNQIIDYEDVRRIGKYKDGLIKQILANQRLRELVEKRIKEIDINITGADRRIHPEIYSQVMAIHTELQNILDEAEKDG